MLIKLLALLSAAMLVLVILWVIYQRMLHAGMWKAPDPGKWYQAKVSGFFSLSLLPGLMVAVFFLPPMFLRHIFDFLSLLFLLFALVLLGLALIQRQPVSRPLYNWGGVFRSRLVISGGVWGFVWVLLLAQAPILETDPTIIIFSAANVIIGLAILIKGFVVHVFICEEGVFTYEGMIKWQQIEHIDTLLQPEGVLDIWARRRIPFFGAGYCHRIRLPLVSSDVDEVRGLLQQKLLT